MKNILEIKNLNLYFNLDGYKAQALYDISINIEEGSALGIVGESGCGKSLTAMSVMKLLPKNAVTESGEIIFKDKNLLNLNENEMQKIRGSKIALIPQDPMSSLNPLYTVENQLTEVIKTHLNVSDSEAFNIAVKNLESVNIPDAEKRIRDYPHEFSGGMKQRVLIAMALSCNPELIIADEPTTALDVTIQAQIIKLIDNARKDRNTSLMLITHDLGVISEVCENVCVMYAGRIVESAPSTMLFRKPCHPYTKALMQSLPAVNIGKLKTIPGQPPEITDNIAGCVFHPRCLYKMDICENIIPEIVEIQPNHKAACHLLNA
jgi:oligopeptide transport system ATP-binding protein